MILILHAREKNCVHDVLSVWRASSRHTGYVYEKSCSIIVSLCLRLGGIWLLCVKDAAIVCVCALCVSEVG